jgi:nucleoside-diphosphate-sugar epimerase
MSSCIIFGGSGFIGTYLAEYFLSTGRFSNIHIADIRKSPLSGVAGIAFSYTDVREKIPLNLIDDTPEWIFNLAAVHREPGHQREEYFATNLAGARNICEFADKIGCDNIYFTSSIAVYGPTSGPTSEDSPIQPSSPYGSSKYAAELIHEMWHKTSPGRKLVIARPGVLYGPKDPGNILRMIKAIIKGYFAFPGSPGVLKSYGYIYGFLDSVDFALDSDLGFFRYNYVEFPTQPLNLLVDIVKKHFGINARVFPLPLPVLLPIAKVIHKVLGEKNPIHPVRVKKAAMSTHIIPRALIKQGFLFRYDFESSLKHWLSVSPEDFGDINRQLPKYSKTAFGRQKSLKKLTVKMPGAEYVRDQVLSEEKAAR